MVQNWILKRLHILELIFLLSLEARAEDIFASARESNSIIRVLQSKMNAFTSFMSRCWRNNLRTMTSWRIGGRLSMSSATSLAVLGPLATSKLTSKARPVSVSSNLMMGTFAIAITCSRGGLRHISLLIWEVSMLLIACSSSSATLLRNQFVRSLKTWS